MARFLYRLGLFGGAVFLITLASGGAAVAQTGYPPPATTPLFCPAGSASGGSVGVGSTITMSLCGPFQPGAAVPLTVNGQAAGSKTANANGSVNIVITVTSTSAAEINDPVSVPINCGSNNNFSASGPGAEISTTSSAGTFTVQCSATNTNLVKTGVNVLKYLVVALVLISIGTALVLLQRRRAHAR